MTRTKRLFTGTIAGASFAFILSMAACAPSGYYDNSGVYHAYGSGDTARHDHTAVPGGEYNTASAQGNVYDHNNYNNGMP